MIAVGDYSENLAPLVSEELEWVSNAGYVNTGMIYLVNIIYPWLQLSTNPDLNGTGDCYDSCGTSMGFIMVLFVPHLIIYGLPLITMILYSAVG